MDIIELIKVITNLLWLIFAFVLFLTFRKPVARILSRVKKGKILGNEFELDEPLILLDELATQSAADVKALPAPESVFKRVEPAPKDYPVVEQVLMLAGHSP